MMVKRAEILAPAGGVEQLTAAVRCCADAVYLGSKKFNARRNASNFDFSELSAAADYCHTAGVKLYATLNTLVSDNELYDALVNAEKLCECGVDALIVQDLGLAAQISRRSLIPLHASTQMSVGTPDGFRELAELGFKRAVLPRELSFDEIDEIAKLGFIETECFVHGALCMSVSGQCYLSSMLGSRSGNRGLCAQPCRLPFSNDGGDGCFLSLKDLSLIHRLKDLQSSGVTSFKIEGRMKRAEYVACAVAACRQALDGELSKETENALQDVFSRSGFTEGHFLKKRDKSMFGIRRKEDVERCAAVLSNLKHLYEKETPRTSVDFEFVMKNGEPPILTVKSGELSASIKGDSLPEPALKKALDEDTVKAQLSKCGGTVFFAGNILCKIDRGLSLPVSKINLMRRQGLEDISKLICSKSKYSFDLSPIDEISGECSEPKNGQRIFARYPDISLLKDGETEIAYIPLPQCAEKGFDASCFKTKIYAELPRMFFGSAERVRELVNRAAENSVSGFFAGGLDGIALLKDSGFDIHASFGVNAYNSNSICELRKLGVSSVLISPELTVKQVSETRSSSDIGVFAYGRLPLMLTRACPMQNCGGCGKCSSPELTDRKGVEFPVKCNFGFTELLNSVPTYMADKLCDIERADYLLLYFTTESRREIEHIINSYKNSASPQGEFTRGLFYRGSM